MGRLRTVLLAAVLAVGGTTALKCVMQKYYELPLTLREWQERVRPALIEQGHDPSDPTFVNYERRLKSAEPQGFLSHPNITASLLMMSGLVTAGVAAALWPRRGRVTSQGQARPRGAPADADEAANRLRCGVAAVLVVATAWALWTTGSLGAVLGGLAGVGLLLLLGVPRVARLRPGPMLALFTAAYVGLIAVGLAMGVARGTLPSASLAFRWTYWTTAWRAYEDVPLTGLGRENFATEFMRYKPASATEEVRNPHNLWVGLLVELGPLGLAAGVCLCGFALFAALRAARGVGGSRCSDARGLRSADVVMAAGFGAAVLVSHGLASGEAASADALLLWFGDVALRWTGLFAAALWLLMRRGASETGSADSAGQADEHAARVRLGIEAGIAAAFVALLVHSLIDFTLFTPGGLSLATLLAVHVGTRAGASRGATARRGVVVGRVVAVAVMLLALVQIVLVARPAGRVEAATQRVEALVRGDTPADSEAMRGALRELLALPGVGPGRLYARVQMQFAAAAATRGDFEGARSYASAAMIGVAGAKRANPHDTNVYRLMARVLEMQAEYEPNSRGAAARRYQAAEDWNQAVKWHPTNPRTRIAAAEAWLRVWRTDGDIVDGAEAARRARENFRAALEIDATRPPETAEKLRPAELQQIEGGLAELGTAGE